MFQYWFSEHVEQYDLRVEIGEAFIAMVIITVMVNLGFTVHKVVQTIRNRLRRYRERKARLQRQ